MKQQNRVHYTGFNPYNVPAAPHKQKASVLGIAFLLGLFFKLKED